MKVMKKKHEVTHFAVVAKGAIIRRKLSRGTVEAAGRTHDVHILSQIA